MIRTISCFEKPLERSVESIINEIYPRLDNVKFGLLETTITNPEKWSDEEPNLYTLVLSLEDSTGNMLEAKTCRVGFRSIEFCKREWQTVDQWESYLFVWCQSSRPSSHKRKSIIKRRYFAGCANDQAI